MTRMHLPQGHSQRDLLLAERVANRLGLRELTVCHVQPGARTRAVVERAPAPGPAGGLIAELAVGLAFLVNAVVEALSQRTRVAR